MRWLTYLLLVISMLTLQSTVAPSLALLGGRPDWLLVVVVFFALHAAPRDAVYGAALIGLGGDLMSVERLGLLTLSYALTAMLIVSLRDYLFRNESVTRLLVTLAVGLLVRTVWMGYRRFLYDPAESLLSEWAIGVVWSAAYTALWAPPMHGVLGHMSRLFGLTKPRYSFAGLHRLRDARV